MTRSIVDTNVPIVANGRPDRARGSRAVSVSCRVAAVELLMKIIGSGTLVLDLAGEIQGEYRRHLSPRGQPGVGDLFYLTVLQSAPKKVERVVLPRNTDGSYVDFPDDPALARFDRSDRKFAALARRERVPVSSATDSDWLDFRVPLAANGIDVDFVCGDNRETRRMPSVDSRQRAKQRQRDGRSP